MAVIRKIYPQLSDITAEKLQNTILLADKLSINKKKEIINCFRTPTNNCMDCGNQLQLPNEPTEVVFSSLKGSRHSKKISLWFQSLQNLLQLFYLWKERIQISIYEEFRPAVEISDNTLVDWDALKLYCSLA